MSAHELPASSPPDRPADELPLRGTTPLVFSRLSHDGTKLMLLDAAGVQFSVDVEPRLRGALSEAPDRRLEIGMDSILRPRDIQARIRCGETPESVAQAAQTTVDKVMPYAAPVLAEREHVAQRAQRSSIRRPAGESAGTARTLGDAVAGRLRGLNVDPETTVAWDAWRREDGRWSLIGRYHVAEASGLGEFTFDQPGNFVVLDNDDARWLVGDLTIAAADLPPTQPETSPTRRLSSVPDEQLPLGDKLGDQLGDDAIQLVSDQPVEAFLDDRAGFDDPEPADADAEPSPVLPDLGPESSPELEVPARRTVRKTRGRASVPTWDEIMFGGKPE